MSYWLVEERKKTKTKLWSNSKQTNDGYSVNITTEGEKILFNERTDKHTDKFTIRHSIFATNKNFLLSIGNTRIDTFDHFIRSIFIQTQWVCANNKMYQTQQP